MPGPELHQPVAQSGIELLGGPVHARQYSGAAQRFNSRVIQAQSPARFINGAATGFEHYPLGTLLQHLGLETHHSNQLQE